MELTNLRSSVEARYEVGSNLRLGKTAGGAKVTQLENSLFVVHLQKKEQKN